MLNCREKRVRVMTVRHMRIFCAVCENDCSTTKAAAPVSYTHLVDLDAARAKGVKVSNAAGYSNEAVAELTLCMMLALLRNVPQVEARCRAGQTKDGLVLSLIHI